jgi:hypothetical protein
MTEARDQLSERLSRAIDDESARRVQSTVVPLAWAFGGGSAGFALAHLLYLTGALRWRMVSLAGVTAAISFTVAALIERRPSPLRTAHAQQTFIGALPLLNGAAHLLWTLDPAQATNLALFQLAAGFVMLSPRWFAAFTASIAACVVRAAYLAHGDRAFHHFRDHLARRAVRGDRGGLGRAGVAREPCSARAHRPLALGCGDARAVRHRAGAAAAPRAA